MATSLIAMWATRAAGRSDLFTDPSGNSYMTAHDFFLLFAAFGGFVIVPALLLRGFSRLAHRKHSGRRGPGIRPDVDSTDASTGDETKEPARSGKANEFLRWLNTKRRLRMKAAHVVVHLRSGAGGKPWRRRALPTV